ncbi:hypothetical protein dsmv_0820 [Desulfococcus multivorans DSM 2059]|uniref:Uncharacterized protein n=2 Tax=Desulfococcaceae TaxID=2931039 RepID=S7T9J0_DESML|nr:hypothetical protein dsmv_0820 [Desulfococcus multivorans DSM 2059]SKA14347.1 hypothetical protein SAMN02745446_02950 [Desulfococcus multivorans DSM 2059]
MMTSTTELLSDLFTARLETLAAEHGLTTAETERILAVFRQALANPFMTEEHIYRKLSGEDT